MLGEKTVSELAREFDVHPSQVTQWKEYMIARSALVFSPQRAERSIRTPPPPPPQAAAPAPPAAASIEIATLLRTELLKATRQIEAFIAVEDYLRTGQLPSLSTERHTWPISPDLALFLARVIEDNDYDLIIEFGSGVSTVLIAKALYYKAQHSPSKKTARFVSFEHLETFQQQTLRDLKRKQLDYRVDLQLAPLIRQKFDDDAEYDYYDCKRYLARLSRQFNGKKILVFVDGPPAATGPHARYPALPVVMACIKPDRMDILLDDYIRQDEKEIVQRWLALLAQQGKNFTSDEIRLEKDAFLIRIEQAREPIVPIAQKSNEHIATAE